MNYNCVLGLHAGLVCEDKPMNRVPLLKKKTIDTNYPLPIDSATKAELRALKADHGVDTNQWLRSLIRSELPKLKKRLETA